MTGIRVTGIPDDVTESQLKAHFSNPKNCGGRVREIYYPLQAHTAVILFDSPTVMMEIFKTKHHLAGYELDIFPLPRQIYDKGIMEIEKSMSVLLSFHPALIDLLQYVGNLKVDFDYNQECYMVKGNWYQLEWALHLLDRSLDSVEGIQKDGHEDNTKEKTSNDGSPRSGSPERSPMPRSPSPTLREQLAPLLPESPTLRSQSPPLRSPSPPLRSLSMDGEPFSSITQNTGFGPPTYVYKSLFHDDASRPKESKYGHDKGSRAPGRKNKNKNLQPKAGQNKNTTGPPVRPEPSYRDTKKGHAPVRGRGLAFGRDTDFTENKPRPKRQGPQMTSGLDVSLTNFGEKQLSFSFELNGCLKVMVVKADITKQRTDGIVSPNTPGLSNSYGVASAIARAADKRFQAECQRYVHENGPLEMAEVMHTDAGGNLNHHVGFILHVVGPSWQEKDSEASMHYLVCTYLNCFHYSETVLWMKSLSTPLISAGAYGFPLDACIQAFFDALLIHVSSLSQSPHLQEICLVCFDSDSAGAAIMILQSLLEVDRKHSESEALFRYNTGCSKYGFHAKTLKNSPDKAVGIPNAEEEFRIIGKHGPEDKESSDSDEPDDKDEKRGIVNRNKNDTSYNSTAMRSPDVKLEPEQPLIFSKTASKSREMVEDDIVEATGKTVNVNALSEESFVRQEVGELVSEKQGLSGKEEPVSEIEAQVDKDDTEETSQHVQDMEFEKKDLVSKESVFKTEAGGLERKRSGNENDDHEAKREEIAAVVENLHGKFNVLEIEEQKKVDEVKVKFDDVQNKQFKCDATEVIQEKTPDEDTTMIAHESESKLDEVQKEDLCDLKESSVREADINKLENNAEKNQVADKDVDFETVSKDVVNEAVSKDVDTLPQVENDFDVEFETMVFVEEKTSDLLKSDARMSDPDSELNVCPDVQTDTFKSASGTDNDSITDAVCVKSDEGEDVDFSQSQWSIMPENLVTDKIAKEDETSL